MFMVKPLKNDYNKILTLVNSRIVEQNGDSTFLVDPHRRSWIRRSETVGVLTPEEKNEQQGGPIHAYVEPSSI